MDSLFIPDLQPALKHPTVFKKFDSLKGGESFELINDHDPIPLFYELKAERGDVFEWKKLENGPEVWRVEISKTADQKEVKTQPIETATSAGGDEFVLNVTLIEPRFKHPTIFRHFDELKEGEAFQILNDHDPKPLYYQMIAERGNVFSWEYLQKGPQWYKVRIRKNDVAAGESIGQIAAKDIRKAEVFKKYGIDFCCGGKKSLKQVCEESGLDAATIEAELDQVQTKPQGENFDRWEPDFLADYIYNKHHRFYYDEAPVISDLLAKVVGRHGNQHQELELLQALYKKLTAELDTHFMKEEKVLFPFIKALVNAKKTGSTAELYNGFSITQPVQMMESDHEAAGEILVEMRKLANDYTTPADACNSYQFLYQKLKALEEDLHQHIHLENNILFPKALKLEKELRS